jgi:hypothetical protein
MEEKEIIGLIKIEAENKFKRCTVKSIKQIVKRKGYVTSRTQIYKLLRHRLGGKWRRSKNQNQYVNSYANIIKRETFAKILIQLVEQKKKILNFDECSINETYGQKYSWFLPNSQCNLSHSKRIDKLSVQAVVGMDGMLFYQFVLGSGNELTFSDFIY